MFVRLRLQRNSHSCTRLREGRTRFLTAPRWPCRAVGSGQRAVGVAGTEALPQPALPRRAGLNLQLHSHVRPERLTASPRRTGACTPRGEPATRPPPRRQRRAERSSRRAAPRESHKAVLLIGSGTPGPEDLRTGDQGPGAAPSLPRSGLWTQQPRALLVTRPRLRSDREEHRAQHRLPHNTWGPAVSGRS